MSGEWPSAHFGQVMRPNSRPYLLGPDEDANLVGMRLYGGGPFHRELKPAMQIAKKSHFVVRSGDVIYNKLFAWKGAFGIVPHALDGMFVSDKFPTYELDRSKVEPGFLHWYFRCPPLWEQALAMSTGSAALSKLTLNPPKFLLLTMPLPPLDEQRRIVARIDELAAHITEARTLRQQVAQEAEALFFSSLRQVRQLLLDSPCQRASLGSVTKVTSGGTPARDNACYWNGDIPWVKTGELLDGEIYKTEECITKAGLENSSAKLFPPDTVLVALYGQGQTRGRTGRLRISATTNQACCALLPKPSLFEARYLQFWLRSLYLELREDAQGGAQPNWSGAMIKALHMALPPLPEQRRIVAELDALQAEVDALKRLQAESAAELDALLPSILDVAFKGEL